MCEGWWSRKMKRQKNRKSLGPWWYHQTPTHPCNGQTQAFDVTKIIPYLFKLFVSFLLLAAKIIPIRYRYILGNTYSQICQANLIQSWSLVRRIWFIQLGFMSTLYERFTSYYTVCSFPVSLFDGLFTFLFISPFTVTFEDLFSNCATCYSSSSNSHIYFYIFYNYIIAEYQSHPDFFFAPSLNHYMSENVLLFLQ